MAISTRYHLVLMDCKLSQLVMIELSGYGMRLQVRALECSEVTNKMFTQHILAPMVYKSYPQAKIEA